MNRTTPGPPWATPCPTLWTSGGDLAPHLDIMIFTIVVDRHNDSGMPELQGTWLLEATGDRDEQGHPIFAQFFEDDSEPCDYILLPDVVDFFRDHLAPIA